MCRYSVTSAMPQRTQFLWGQLWAAVFNGWLGGGIGKKRRNLNLSIRRFAVQVVCETRDTTSNGHCGALHCQLFLRYTTIDIPTWRMVVYSNVTMLASGGRTFVLCAREYS